jgi:excinuclease UvrABC nuclease subunit
MAELSDRIAFKDVDWTQVPESPGVYVIHDNEEVIYVGMSGRNGKGTLRSRLRDHCSGQIVNMFAQYLFLARIQPTSSGQITHPRDAQRACRDYIASRCSFRYGVTEDAAQARQLEKELKAELKPTLNP